MAATLCEALMSPTGRAYVSVDDETVKPLARWLARRILLALGLEHTNVNWDDCLGIVARASSRTTVPLWRLRGLESKPMSSGSPPL